MKANISRINEALIETGLDSVRVAEVEDGIALSTDVLQRAVGLLTGVAGTPASRRIDVDALDERFLHSVDPGPHICGALRAADLWIAVLAVRPSALTDNTARVLLTSGGSKYLYEQVRNVLCAIPGAVVIDVSPAEFSVTMSP